MTASKWADKLSPKYANSLIEAISTPRWKSPMSPWDVFETIANYEGGLTAHEARDLIREVYGIDLR